MKVLAPTPLNSPNRLHVRDGSVAEDIELEVIPRSNSPRIPNAALPLIRSSDCPLPPLGLVSSADPDPLLKDATRFIMEFDGYAGTLVTSIYNPSFLNKVFID